MLAIGAPNMSKRASKVTEYCVSIAVYEDVYFLKRKGFWLPRFIAIS